MSRHPIINATVAQPAVIEEPSATRSREMSMASKGLIHFRQVDWDLGVDKSRPFQSISYKVGLDKRLTSINEVLSHENQRKTYENFVRNKHC